MGNSISPWQALGSGLVGACALTLLHESARRLLPNAPRMDILGMRAIAKSLRKMDQEPPEDDKLHTISLMGDIAGNAAYYSLVGTSSGKEAWIRGSLLGLAAGLGAVFLPGPLGLGREPSQKTPATQGMTVAWYLVGGLAAAAATHFFNSAYND